MTHSNENNNDTDYYTMVGLCSSFERGSETYERAAKEYEEAMDWAQSHSETIDLDSAF